MLNQTENTLTETHQVINGVSTREQLLAALDAVFTLEGFKRTGITESDASHVTASGIPAGANPRSCEVNITARPDESGTGLLFDVFAKLSIACLPSKAEMRVRNASTVMTMKFFESLRTRGRCTS